MRATDDEIALLVAAYEFQLLDTAGNVVMRLAESFGTLSLPNAGLVMRHRFAGVQDSVLSWTTGPATTPSTSLRGPTVGLNFPELLLTRSPFPRSLLRNGVNNFVQVESDDTGTTGGAQVRAAGTAGAGVILSADVTTDARLSELTLSATAGTAELVGAGGAGGAGRLTLNGATNEAVLNVNATGGGSAEMRYVDRSNACAVFAGNVAGLGDLNNPAGARYIRSGDNLSIEPAEAGGIITVNARQMWCPVDMRTAAFPSVSPVGFRSFLMNGVTMPNCQPGDRFLITSQLRVNCIAAGGAFVIELQPFTPAGSGILNERGIAVGWTAGTDDTITTSWLLEAGVSFPWFGGTGGYTFTIVGGGTGGSWGITAPDNWFTVQQWAQR